MSNRSAGRARVLPVVIVALTAVAGMAAPAVFGAGAGAATTTLCNGQTASVGGGNYIVQNNEWNSGASECVTTDGNADFTVANSAISNATNGAPGGYPSIYQGCHWGHCSSGGLAATPVQASNLGTDPVTTSWSTTQTGSGAYDVAYDIWFNTTSTTAGEPNCMELMVWLNHQGPVQPFGSEVATDVSIGGHSYDVWEGAQISRDTVSYTMTAGTTSVSNLDVGQLAQDAINRGYMPSSCWLIDVEAGFELWQGGAGLATQAFSVNTNGAGNTVTVTSPGAQTGTVGTPASVQVRASDSASGQTLSYGASGLPPGLSINSSTGLISGTPTSAGTYSATVTARDTTAASGSATFTWTISSNGGGGGGSCTATYAIVNSWPGGFQAKVTVTAGASGLAGWSVGWTYAGNQKITTMWNASFRQSGQGVTASNASYNGRLAAAASTTFGFNGNYAGTNAVPASLSCT